jgi:hypothetical protein
VLHSKIGKCKMVEIFLRGRRPRLRRASKSFFFSTVAPFLLWCWGLSATVVRIVAVYRENHYRAMHLLYQMLV